MATAGLERSKGPRKAGALLLDHFEESFRLAVLEALLAATLYLFGLCEVTRRPLHSLQSSQLVQAGALCFSPCQGGKVDGCMGGGSFSSHSQLGVGRGGNWIEDQLDVAHTSLHLDLVTELPVVQQHGGEPGAGRVRGVRMAPGQTAEWDQG